jgi:hypothetical protein
MTAPPATLGMALGLLRDAGAEPLARPPIPEEKDRGINESPERFQKIASTLSEDKIYSATRHLLDYL